MVPPFIGRPIIIVTTTADTILYSMGISKEEVAIQLVSKIIIVSSYELFLRMIVSIRVHQVGRGPSHVLQ